MRQGRGRERGAGSKHRHRLGVVPDAVILSAVRTPIGRYGGVLAGERPDDLARARDPRGGRARRSAGGGDRGRLLRRREPGGRGQPQRRAHGGAPGRTSPGRRRRDGEPALRVGALGGRRGMPRRSGRVRRPLRRGRRRVDDPRAVRLREGRARVRPRHADGLGHDARLALPESEDGGDVPARVDGRDRRERGRALRVSRAKTRMRSPSRAIGAGRPPTRQGASPTSSFRSARSSATSIRGRTRASRSSPRFGRRSARAGRSRRETRAA